VGLDAFTMRGLAAELGIGTMTLYGYFRTKDQLLDALIDAGAEELFEIPYKPRSWDARLRQLFLNLHRSHLKHPAIVELRYKRPLLSPGALRFTEICMEILTAAGFDNRDAARAYRLLFVYTFGSSAFGPGRRPQADREQTVAALSGLPVDLYPALLGAAKEAADAMADESLFEFGLELLLEGLKKGRRRSINQR
jgi:AcrR family transcriptional regulator